MLYSISRVVELYIIYNIHYTEYTLYSIHWYTMYIVQCILYTRGCSKITDFFAGGVIGSLYIREHCCKVSAKKNDRYPSANAILCLHLNNSTRKLCSNTWLSPTRFLTLNDCFSYSSVNPKNYYDTANFQYCYRISY